MATRALTWSDLELLNEVGGGQAGTVFRARIKRPARGFSAGDIVALKRFRRWVLEQPGQAERIVRELEIGRRLSHPNLVRTFGIVFDDAASPALVMEFCEGMTLEALLQLHRVEHRPLQTATALAIITDLVDGIRYLHSNSVAHRDLKPSNILLTSSGAKIGDLGVVQAPDFPEQTTTGRFLGTLRYGAPSYIFGDDDGPNVDLYSLGATIFEVLTTRVFMGEIANWARVIAAKETPFSLDDDALQVIRHNHGPMIAAIAQWLLTRCFSGDAVRLESVADVLHSDWRAGVSGGVHSLRLGFTPKTDKSSFASPDEAARKLPALVFWVLEPLMLHAGLVIQPLEEHRNIRFKNRKRHEQEFVTRLHSSKMRYEDLVRCGAMDYSPAGRRQVFADYPEVPNTGDGWYKVDPYVHRAYLLDLVPLSDVVK